MHVLRCRWRKCLRITQNIWTINFDKPKCCHNCFSSYRDVLCLSNTMFENHSKSLISKQCERSERYFVFQMQEFIFFFKIHIFRVHIFLKFTFSNNFNFNFGVKIQMEYVSEIFQTLCYLTSCWSWWWSWWSCWWLILLCCWLNGNVRARDFPLRIPKGLDWETLDVSLLPKVALLRATPSFSANPPPKVRERRVAEKRSCVVTWKISKNDIKCKRQNKYVFYTTKIYHFYVIKNMQENMQNIWNIGKNMWKNIFLHIWIFMLSLVISTRRHVLQLQLSQRRLIFCHTQKIDTLE